MALLVGPAVAQVESFGRGCDVGTGVPPALIVAPRPGPRVDTRAFVLGGPGARGVALLVGTSRTTWGATRLPLRLDGFGLPGCELLVAPDVMAGLGIDGSVVLPTSLLPAGASVHLQGVVANGTGLPVGLSQGVSVSMPDPLAPFVIAMLPDTQFYAQRPELFFHFAGQTDWVVRNRDQVRFAVQVGDVVQSGARYPDEWVRADRAIDRLDGVVPHNVALGNHDMDVVGDKASTVEYVRWFGPQRYQGRPWFGGASANGRNSFQLFEGAGITFLHLSLEWRPSDAAIAWAQEVLAAHPHLPTILTTHEHLGTGAPASWRGGGATRDGTGDNDGEQVHRKLVEPFPQIFLVLCGHVIGRGERTDTTPLGQTVHAMLADYQGDPNGGNGFFRTLRFDARRQVIEVRSLSPTFVPGTGPDHSIDPAHNFDLAYDPLAHRAQLAGRQVARFRMGQDLGAGAYAGTVDTHIGDGAAGGTLPGQSRGSDDLVWCDGDQDHNQGLLRFDGLVGTAPGQVPPGATIRGAWLTVTSEGANAQSPDGGSFHRMLVPWTETSTWNALGNGVQLGTEAVAQADASSVGMFADRVTGSIDVTASVRAWANGAPNHGWVIVANGSNGWAFRSADWVGIAERPMLTVVW